MATQEVNIYIQENGETRELLGEEKAKFLAQLESDRLEAEAQEAILKEIANKKQAILDRLNLTEADVKLLLM